MTKSMEDQLDDIMHIAQLILTDAPRYPPDRRRAIAEKVRRAWQALQAPSWTKAQVQNRILQALDRAGHNLDGMLLDIDKDDDATTARDARDVAAREIQGIFAHPFAPRIRVRAPDPKILLACVEAWRPSRARGRGRPAVTGPGRDDLTSKLLAQIGVSDERNTTGAVRKAAQRHVGAKRVPGAKERAAKEAAQLAEIEGAIRQLQRTSKKDKRS
jgi:hypothetical protein